MQEKRIPVLDEEPKYKKRSNAKGQPRSKHKHVYETVLLTRDFSVPDYKTGRTLVKQRIHPTRVCAICGRIGYEDDDESLFVKRVISDLPVKVYEKVLSDKALRLPKWHSNDYFNKFATKSD
jgi:hypothetical protein